MRTRHDGSEDISHLLTVGAIAQLGVELTTNCNLGCVYCHFAPMSRRGNDASPEVVQQIVAFARIFPIDIVTLAGDSEITLYPGWTDVATTLLDAGVKLRIISNFSRGLFSDAEIETLSRFSEILVSLDSCDHELMKKVRYRADLRTMATNFERVRAEIVRDGRPFPSLVCNVTLYDRNVGHLDRTAAFAIALGFNKIQVNPFVELEEVPGGVNDLRDNPKAWAIRQVDQLSAAEAVEARRAIAAAERLARSHSVPLTIHAREKLDAQLGKAGAAPPRQAGTGGGGRRTKRCLMPWDYLHVFWDGTVPPCCIVKDQKVGSSLAPGGLAGVVNGPEMKALRRGLLTGDLPDLCAACTYVDDTTTDELRLMLERWITSRPGRAAGPAELARAGLGRARSEVTHLAAAARAWPGRKLEKLVDRLFPPRAEAAAPPRPGRHHLPVVGESAPGESAPARCGHHEEQEG